MIDQNRQELYKGIWNLANGLRGSIDAWEFKNYVLGFLFYRYISEDFANYVNGKSDASEGFSYENESDDAEWIEHMKDLLIQEKGYFIYPSDLFINIKRRADLNKIDDLNEEIGYAFSRIEASTQCSGAKQSFEGLFKLIDLSDNKLGREIMEKNRRIKEIINGIQEMNCKLGESDVFGDAYEYLISMYAANAGKTGGEFYTPPEVSELLVKLITQDDKNKSIRTVYDPTCGSGSLLLKFGTREEIDFFGQEINFTTYTLCKMNMFLHRVGYNQFDIAIGNTLTDDKFKDRKFDAIVSNPPYGTKWDGNTREEFHTDPRFKGPGVLAPNNKSDFAFIMHSLYHLNDDGIAAIVCFPGILFRDKAEKEIRKWLIENNHIYAVIRLPEKLFFGTEISTCILVLKKNRTENDGDVLFVDARYQFEKTKGRNKLTPEIIDQITKFYVDRKDVDEHVKIATKEDIREKDYDLSVHTYVIREEVEEQIDIASLNQQTTELFREVNELNQHIDKLIEKIKAGQ